MIKKKLQYIHLRVHSSYSLLEGALPIDRLVNHIADLEMPAVGLTDSNNLFGVLEFSEKCAAKGIQPIIGCTLAVKFEPISRSEKSGVSSLQKLDPLLVDGELAFIAQNEQGYRNLISLSSKAFLAHGDEHSPYLTFEEIKQHNEGLICLTGGYDGPLDQAIASGRASEAGDWLQDLKRVFDDRLYIELQRHGQKDQDSIESELCTLAEEYKIPLVASNECYFLAREDYEAHDALICIAEGAYVSEEERRRLTQEHYLKPANQMAELFSDLPEAIDNTIEIAKRCSYRPTTHAPILPKFISNGASSDSEKQLKAEAKALQKLAREGLKKRLTKIGKSGETFAPEEDYWQRLEYELKIIEDMKFPGYFLIVADFIQWAKNENIAVGPGRGSGAGSVVAWALTITDLDPLRFGLLFERFLNPERISMPDFDIDFCQTRRDEVIHYVQKKYGDDRVAQIITFGKLQARAVLRDVGRVLHMPYGQVDRLCKLVPNNPANPVSLEEALSQEPKLAEARAEEKIVERLIDISLKLEGLYRHASTHAAGVVIGDRPLTELVPLYRDPRSDLPVTQFNMKWVEPAGLVKFDFLGLKTLSVIEKAKELIERGGHSIDIANLPLDDQKTFEVLASGDTAGVFQLESTGMRDSLRRLKPDRFEDIIAMVALYRPGPMDNIPSYINRKQGLEAPDYFHDKLVPILEETYGVIIYQEQVMQIAQILSGYSLGEADMLRRAMGKKIKAEMKQQKNRFVEGAVAQGVEKRKAADIFEVVDKFAGYGFNKSHAAAYALLAYQTAYLKANHPVEFLAASMTFDMGNTDKLAMFTQEAAQLGIAIVPPCVNRSSHEFLPYEKSIIYSMAALKNIGSQAVIALGEERKENGAYQDIFDFSNRLDPKTINKRGLETLAQAGAFDELNPNRAEVFTNAERIIAVAQRRLQEKKSGQSDLFGGESAAPAQFDLTKSERWTDTEKLTNEFNVVGFYLSGHPIDSYQSVLRPLDVIDWQDFQAKAMGDQRMATLAGTVTEFRERRSRNGNPFAFVTFSDRSGQFEAVVFSDTLESCRSLLESNQPLLIKVEADVEEESVRLRVLGLQSLEQAAKKMVSGLCVMINRETDLSGLVKELKEHQGRGRMQLSVKLSDFDREVLINLPGRYDTSLERASVLRQLPGVQAVKEL